jgi:hypothetical protein
VSYERPTSSEILAEVLATRGSVTPQEAARLTGVDRRYAARLLRELVAAHSSVQRDAIGRYSSDQAWTLSKTAQDLHATLRELHLPAHLTGPDLLRGLEHQVSLRGAPHLVYADKKVLSELAHQLGRRGWIAVSPNGARDLAVQDPDRVVVLRGQAAGLQKRLRVTNFLASPEKAWLDLLRESERHVLPVSPYDAGRMLAAGLFLSTCDGVALEKLAKQSNWWKRVAPVVGKAPLPAEDDFTRSVAAGFIAEAGVTA